MNKLWLIIQREYLSRVKKKTFILTTILTPIGFVLFWIALIFIMSSGVEKKRMALLDPSNILQIDKHYKLRDGLISFGYPNDSLEALKLSFEEDEYDGIVYIPQQKFDSLSKDLKVEFYTNTDIGLTARKAIENAIERRTRKVKMEAFALNEQMLKNLDTDIGITTKNLKKETKEASDAKTRAATVLGFLMMFLIYFVIFIYGNMVMRSVMEEKTNRIVEVIISSVKPFQLMLGKIVGVGAVGLTQFAVWALVFPLLYMGVGLIFAGKLQEFQSLIMTSTPDTTSDMGEMIAVVQEFMTFDHSAIIGYFLIYFLLGYILYASLFAAVGAAMGDDWGEGQSLTLIVAIPVIIAFYLGIAAIENPSSSLATWSSIVPLFSPIIMPARIIFEPPTFDIILSLVLLVLNCLLFIWISGRIYRVGILMYGKKTSLREFITWIFRSN